MSAQPLTLVEILAVVSAATALVAVIVGPISAYYIAKKQITASVISANRQAWINELRDHLAQVHSILFRLPMTLKTPVATTVVTAPGQFAGLRDAIEEATLIRAKIVLMLNPKEQAHKDLAEALDAALSVASAAASQDSASALTSSFVRVAAISARSPWRRSSGRLPW